MTLPVWAGPFEDAHAALQANQFQQARQQLNLALKQDEHRASLALAYMEHGLLRLDRSHQWAARALKSAKNPQQKAAANLAEAHALWGRRLFDPAYAIVSRLKLPELSAQDRIRYFILRGWLEGIVANQDLAEKNFRQALREAKGDARWVLETRLAWLAMALELGETKAAKIQLERCHGLISRSPSSVSLFRTTNLGCKLLLEQKQLGENVSTLNLAISLASQTGARIWQAKLLSRLGEKLSFAREFDLAEAKLQAAETILIEEKSSSELLVLFERYGSLLLLRGIEPKPVIKRALRFVEAASHPDDQGALLLEAREWSRDSQLEESLLQKAEALYPRLSCPRLKAEILSKRAVQDYRKGQGEKGAALFLNAHKLVSKLDYPELPISVRKHLFSPIRIKLQSNHFKYPRGNPRRFELHKRLLREPMTRQNIRTRLVRLRSEAVSGAIRDKDISEAIAQAKAMLKESLNPMADSEARSVAIGSLASDLSGGAPRGLDSLPWGYRGTDPVKKEVLRRLSEEPKFLETLLSGLQIGDENESILRKFANLTSRARLLLSLGRFEEAEIALKKALSLSSEEKIDFHRGLATHYLSDFYVHRGREREALAVLRDGVRSTKGLMQAALLHDQVYLELELGLDTTETDLRILESRKEKTPRDQLVRARSLMRLRRFEEALQALQIAREDALNRAKADYLRSEIFISQGKSQEAARILESLLEVDGVRDNLMSQRDIVLRLGPLSKDSQSTLKLYSSVAEKILQQGASLGVSGHERRALQLEKNRELLSRLISLALKTGETDLAFAYLERSRSLALLEELSQQSPAGKTAQLMSKVNNLREILRDLETKEKAAKKPSATLTKTRSEFFGALAELKRSDPRFEQVTNFRATDLARVQSLLPVGHLLVLPYPGENTLQLLTVSKSEFQTLQVPVGREHLTKTILSYQQALSTPASGESEREASASELESWLIKPLEERLGDSKALLLVPTGELWNLSLASLFHRQSKPLRELPITFLTSSDLLTLSWPAQKFDGELSLFSNKLPGALREVAAISKSFPKARLNKAQFSTSEQLREQAKRSPVLHLATHSSKGHLELADGPFGLSQIYSLTLPQGALVVLSSCESGASGRPGRDTSSLANAFLTTGASSVVSSLWQVDDQVTAKLFVSFYQHLAKGSGRAEALRLAQRDLARDPKTSHPYYWAAFTLTGDPR